MRIQVGQNEAVVIERLGLFARVLKDEGVYWFLPLLENPHLLKFTQAQDGNPSNRQEFQTTHISLLQQTFMAPPLTVITQDEHTIVLRPSLTYIIVDPVKICYMIHDFSLGLERILQQVLQTTCASLPLPELNDSPQTVQGLVLKGIQPKTLVWGIEIQSVYW